MISPFLLFLTISVIADMNFIRRICFCCSFGGLTTSSIDKPLIEHLAADELKHAAWNNTVPFVPPVTSGKVIKVYDGDTITIATKLYYDADTIYRFSVRLNGIDTPEIKGKTDLEREMALLARDALISKILGRIVVLKNVTTEKYGRLLADVYLGDLCINTWLIDNRFAVPYDGKTKTGFS